MLRMQYTKFRKKVTFKKHGILEANGHLRAALGLFWINY